MSNLQKQSLSFRAFAFALFKFPGGMQNGEITIIVLSLLKLFKSRLIDQVNCKYFQVFDLF